MGRTGQAYPGLADRSHAFGKEHRGEGAPGDFLRDVAIVVLHADLREFSSLLDLRLHQAGEVSQRLLPAEIAGFGMASGMPSCTIVTSVPTETGFSVTVTWISPGMLGPGSSRARWRQKVDWLLVVGSVTSRHDQDRAASTRVPGCRRAW